MSSFIRNMAELFKKQNELNTAICGRNWVKGKCSTGKQIYWGEAIQQELAELVDSFPWKHWKDVDAEIDAMNARVEAIDVLFFVMSEIITTVCDTNSPTIDPIYDVILEVNDYYYNCIDYGPKLSTENDPVYVIINIANKLRKDINDKDLYSKELYSIFMFRTVIDLLLFLELDIDKIYRLYMGKLLLNEFRQENGYKIGVYKKIWCTKEGKKVEDNVVMYETAITNTDIPLEELKEYWYENYYTLS